MSVPPGWRRRLVAPVLLAVAAAAGGSPRIAEPPQVSLEGMDPAVAEQLAEARREIDGLLAGDAAAPALADAWGRLGQLYLAYDIVAPAEAALRNAASLAPQEARWHYLLGALHQNERRLDDALAAYDAVLSLGAGDLPTWIRRGNVLLGLQRFDDAAASFAAAQALAPTAAALTGLGEVAVARGDTRAAIHHFLAALDLQPAATALHYRLAQAYRESGDLEAARRHLSQRGEAEPGFPDPLAQEILDLSTGAGVLLTYGNRALRHGDVGLAIERYRGAIAESPNHPTAHRALAAALARQGDAAGAIAEYRQALSLSPENPSWHYNLAILLAENGDPAAAENHLRSALALLPGYTNARFNLASLLGREGRVAEAVEELERLLQADPSDSPSRRLLAVGLTRLGEDRRAEVELRRLLAEDAADLPARRSLAGLLARSGRYGEAAGELRRLVEADPADEEARFGESMALLLGGDETEARRRLEAGVEALPADRTLRHLLARVLATAGDPRQRDGRRALELAQQLLAERPEPAIAETVAMALAEQGRFAAAAELQQRLIHQATAAGVAAERVAELGRRLQLYERGVPCRSPWREAAGKSPP